MTDFKTTVVEGMELGGVLAKHEGELIDVQTYKRLVDAEPNRKDIAIGYGEAYAEKMQEYQEEPLEEILEKFKEKATLGVH